MKTKDKIYELRLLGKSYNQISDELGVSKPTVSYHCKNLGLNTPISKKPLSSNIIKKINEYYKTHTIKETVEFFNVGRTTIISHVENKRKLLTEIEKKKRNVERVKDRGKVLKEKAVEYKGGKCVKCGYDKYVGALEFHHINDDKKFSIGNKGLTRSWEKIINEIDKCILVCSNCNKELHSELC